MIQIEIGMSLPKDVETTEIYNKFREYFELKEDRYFFIKEPSEELTSSINNYIEVKRKEREKKENEFIEKVALEIFNDLSQEEKNEIFENPNITNEHFGFCLWIRNKYIHPVHPAKFDFYVEPDCLSGEIGSRVQSLILNYDYNNWFYRNLYGSFVFCHLRELYYALKGEYPDSIIESYAGLPDYNKSFKEAEEKIKSIILDENRFKQLSKKYGLTKKQYEECKKVIDKCNKENWSIAPYDIALLGSKKLEPEFRKKILKMMKTVLNSNAFMLVFDLPIFVFNQKDSVLLAVEAGYSSFKRFPKFNSDDEVIRVALKRDGTNLQYVKKELRENPEYIRLSIAHGYDSNSFKIHCMSKYRDDEELIKIAIERDGLNIKYASKRLRDNFEIAKLAIEHSSWNSVMEYLSPRLRDNLELTLLDIKKSGGCGLRYYSRRIRNCDEIAEALISVDRVSYDDIMSLSKRLRNSEKIAKMLIAKGHGYQVSCLSDKIKDSDEIAEALISAGGEEYVLYMSDRIQKKYLKDSEKMVEECIAKGDSYTIHDMSDGIKDSDRIAEALIAKGEEEYILYMSDRIQKKYLKDSEKMVEELISKGGSYRIHYMSDRIKDSDRIAEALIAKGDKRYLTYMSERIQKKYIKGE